MKNLTGGKIEKGKKYYVVRHANKDRKTYAICKTYQKANGLCRAYHNQNWMKNEYNPLIVEKTIYT